MVYNLCLVGALKDKCNNSGLTQRLNQTRLVIFITAILPCSLAWNSSIALGIAFNMLSRTSMQVCSSFCLPTCGYLIFQTPHSSLSMSVISYCLRCDANPHMKIKPKLVLWYWAPLILLRGGREEVSGWTQWCEIWINFLGSPKTYFFILFLIQN